MSEYLGWTERKPATGRASTFDKDEMRGGPVTNSYETYVKNIFHPSNRLKKDKAQVSADRGISASSMLRMERSFGRSALDESYDNDDLCLLKTPLETLYSELGLKSNDSALYRQYPVYMPKQSSEYHSIANGNSERREPEPYRGNYSSFRERADEDYDKNNKKTLIDYQDFSSPENMSFAYDGYMYSPLSPYLYQSHPYVRSQDSRILGSNFVQVTSRPKDRFLEKIDQTLTDVRNMPRYC